MTRLPLPMLRIVRTRKDVVLGKQRSRTVRAMPTRNGTLRGVAFPVAAVLIEKRFAWAGSPVRVDGQQELQVRHPQREAAVVPGRSARAARAGAGRHPLPPGVHHHQGMQRHRIAPAFFYCWFLCLGCLGSWVFRCCDYVQRHCGKFECVRCRDL